MIKEKPVRGSSEKPDHIFISIYDNPETTMAVTWRTDAKITDGYVEYWKEKEEHMICRAETEIFESDIDTSSMFWAHLKDLEPGTKYFYTCGHKVRSEVFSFKTQEKDTTKFKFICVSDQQSGEPHECPDYSAFNSFMKKLLKDNPDTAFILTGGDNTDCGQHEVQWNGTFSGMTGFAESIPFMMSLGNHDNRGFKDYKNGIGRYYAEPATFFDRQFKGSYPFNGPKGWETESYAFDYGNVRFNILSINEPEKVRDWVLEDHAKTDKTWKLGSYHFPICYSGVDCQNYDAYPVMREAFESFDIMFSGHEHNFSRSFPLKNEELFDKPSEGTIHYMLGNSNRNPAGSRTMAKVWHAAYFAHEEKLSMAAVVEVDGSKITLTSIREDGKIADYCVIDKEKDEIFPPAIAPVYGKTRALFKGMYPGLSIADTHSEKKDGVWCGPIGILISFLGGTVERTAGQCRMEAYGHSLTVTDGSAEAVTDRGHISLPIPVYTGSRGQLYVPYDAVSAFDMRWAYAERNNFISVEIESEAKPVPVQPEANR